MKKSVLALLSLFLLVSCKPDIEKYYEVPDWLKGNAYEVMENQGGFSQFMQACERSSFSDLVKGKGIVTVMAPTDEAFTAYLKRNNYASVQDIPSEELDKIVGYHLIKFSYRPQDFLFFNPNGVDNPLLEYGYYFKFRTNSRDVISEEIDEANGGVRRKVMHKDRFIPVISDNSFVNFPGMSPASEYEMMFPDVKYTGSASRFNVANASVVGDPIVTDNGYLYVIDHVLDPMETVYVNLKEKDKYSLFSKMYDRFSIYEYDADASRDFGKGDSLFVHSHYELEPIAKEWTNSYISTIPDYAQTAALSSISFGVFAPDNASIMQFYQKYWSAYPTIESLNITALSKFVSNHMVRLSGKIASPSYCQMLSQTLDVVDDHKMGTGDFEYIASSNGFMLGMSGNVHTPQLFETPIAPALCSPLYNTFALMTDKARLYTIFEQQSGQKFDVFLPNNDMIAQTTYVSGKIEYFHANPKNPSSEVIQVTTSGDPTPISQSIAKEIVGSHITNAILYENASKKIYKTNNPYEYLMQKGDKLYSSKFWIAEKNGEEVDIPTVHPLKNYPNAGNAYSLFGGPASQALLAEKGFFVNRVKQDLRIQDFDGFRELLGFSMSIGNTDPPFNFIQGRRFVCFLPTYAALENDVNGWILNLSGSKADEYGKSLFVNVDESALYDYPFPSNVPSEKRLTTMGKNNNHPVTYTLVKTVDGKMKLRDSFGNEANIISEFPYIYGDGAVYIIDKVLKLIY